MSMVVYFVGEFYYGVSHSVMHHLLSRPNHRGRTNLFITLLTTQSHVLPPTSHPVFLRGIKSNTGNKNVVTFSRVVVGQ